MRHHVVAKGLTIVIVLAGRARGWWDAGHMVVAAVAKSILDQSEVDSIESVLHSWDNEFPGQGDMVSAAVWMDHLKCVHRTPYCKSLGLLSAFEMFNTWHYVENVYNPQNISLSPEYSLMPFPGTGALFALRAALSGLDPPRRLEIGGDLQAVWDEYTCEQDISACTLGQRPNRHINGGDLAASLQPPPSDLAIRNVAHNNSSNNGEFVLKTKEVVTEGFQRDKPLQKHLSGFSWNLRLRILIHIFGDLHQPLHAAETVSREFPNGDLGGNLITIAQREWLNLSSYSDPAVLPHPSTTTQTRVNIPNLHSFWDSCAGQFTQSWPDYTSRNADTAAAQLIGEFPQHTFDGLDRGAIETTFAKISQESFMLAKTRVLDPLANWTADEPFGSIRPVLIPDDYIADAQALCRQRIVLGGYRLAALLRDVMRRGHLNETVDVMFHANTKMPNTAGHRVLGFAAISGALTTGIVLLILLLIRRARSNYDDKSKLEGTEERLSAADIALLRFSNIQQL